MPARRTGSDHPDHDPEKAERSDFRHAVIAVIAAVPAGEVVTYGEVAAEAGFPGAARAVGNLLGEGPSELPWWRVVTADGRLVPGHEREQARHLVAEGVALSAGGTKVRMSRRASR
ncbi:MAG TPA: MGMT family protein [Acidimicrobiales bacterium]|nr:MGMT family protein [Acidimicrobiales bacterium]